MRYRTRLVVPIIFAALFTAVGASQRRGETASVENHSPEIMQSARTSGNAKQSFPRRNWTVQYVSGSLGLKSDQRLKIAFVSRPVSGQIADASIRVHADQLVAFEFNARTEKESDLLQGPRSGCSYARSMMPDTSKSRPEVLVATEMMPGPVSRATERLRPKHPVRFVWNEAGEQRSMMVKVNDCEYQSLVANVRWITGARWQEIGRELK
jgi:hypothetical protein